MFLELSKFKLEKRSNIFALDRLEPKIPTLGDFLKSDQGKKYGLLSLFKLIRSE